MADIIRGIVSYIMDSRTFSLDVTHVGDKNRDQYMHNETVRIANTDSPAFNDPGEKRTKLVLHKRLMGKEVRCHILHRDTYRRVVAEVNVLQTSDATL